MVEDRVDCWPVSVLVFVGRFVEGVFGLWSLGFCSRDGRRLWRRARSHLGNEHNNGEGVTMLKGLARLRLDEEYQGFACGKGYEHRMVWSR